MADMRSNLAGQLRQTYLPKWKALLPLFEAVMNAHQAIQEQRPENPRIAITVVRDDELALGEQPKINSFKVYDNGVGFSDDNMDSFNTSYSGWKLAKGGKGLGRFIWLKAFDSVTISSRFKDVGSTKRDIRREFTFNENYDPDRVISTKDDEGIDGTVVALSGLREPYKSEVPRDLDQIARRMCEHFILVLIQPDCPEIEITDGSHTLSLNSVFRNTFGGSSKAHEFSIKGETFKVYGFRLREPRSARHRLIYCADERAVVSESLDNYVPNLKARLSEEDGQSFVYLAVVTGRYLNSRVNQARTEFDISDAAEGDDDAPQAEMLSDDIRRSDIRDQCVAFARDDLASILSDINTTKLERVRQYVASDAPHYRILLRRSDEFIDRIPATGTKSDLEAALHKELHQREVELKREGGKIITEAAKLTDYDAYKERLSAFMSNYNELGVAALAQYVAHRRIILDFFARAISADQKDGKYPLEKVLHQIVFPMRSTSDDTLLSQQNLWILDERLNYHSFVSSDVRLDKIDGLESSVATRPDLLIFDREFPLSEGGQPLTSLTIVEFKRPMRKDFSDDDNPLKQVVKTINDIRAGIGTDANGRPIAVASADIPTNCYIVCDITPKILEQLRDWDATRTPDGQGYYGYHRTYRLYFEVMDYNKVLRDAERRNKMLFDRLNLL